MFSWIVGNPIEDPMTALVPEKGIS